MIQSFGEQSFVSFGGIGNATSLAKFYAMLTNGGELDGRSFFTEKTIRQMTTILVSGIDRVFQIPTAFSAGFMKDPPESKRRLFGPSPSPSVTREQAVVTRLPILNMAFHLPM
jgi:hypothetical protein